MNLWRLINRKMINQQQQNLNNSGIHKHQQMANNVPSGRYQVNLRRYKVFRILLQGIHPKVYTPRYRAITSFKIIIPEHSGIV